MKEARSDGVGLDVDAALCGKKELANERHGRRPAGEDGDEIERLSTLSNSNEGRREDESHDDRPSGIVRPTHRRNRDRKDERCARRVTPLIDEQRDKPQHEGGKQHRHRIRTRFRTDEQQKGSHERARGGCVSSNVATNSSRGVVKQSHRGGSGQQRR